LTLTYLDSGVLIFAARGTPEAAALALPFIQDPNREFVTSEYVRLEVLPKAIWMHNDPEADFYNAFFAINTRTVPTSAALLSLAMEEASNYGLSALDAIHVACAIFGGAEELVTSEKSTKPIHRTQGVRVVSIFPRDDQAVTAGNLS
jgi:predicted nucleic acid-binding protein